MKATFENQRTQLWITDDNKLAIDMLGIVCEFPLDDARDLNMTITGMVEIMIETEKQKHSTWLKIRKFISRLTN